MTRSKGSEVPGTEIRFLSELARFISSGSFDAVSSDIVFSFSEKALDQMRLELPFYHFLQ